ncbi:hypothetical protein ACVR26_003490 [Cronobacter sakazakii]
MLCWPYRGGGGTAARATLAAGGAYKSGTGIGQLIDSQYSDGALNVGLGSLAIFGDVAGQNVIKKTDTGISSPANVTSSQESTLVKKTFYDKPQEGGILNIGAGNRPIEGAYNISHPDYSKGVCVYAGDVNDLSNIVTGSQKTIIMENPYGFKPFNDEVLRVLDQNGTIIVKGTWNNPTIRKIEREAQKYGFTLTERNVIPGTGFSQTDGKPIANKTVTEYKFKKSGHK